MLSFLAQAACHGKRPSQFASLRAYSRPALVAKLLRERGVARFVVAPSGFGKSTLVLEYAETVFSFNHVFWIDCASPCFLRDLDANAVASQLALVDGGPFLAVFEDVPPLDTERGERLGRLLDALLDGGCEAIVTCTPAADGAFGQLDRMLIGAGDLLLTDDEIDFSRSAVEAGQRCAHDVPRSERVAALAWKGDGAAPFLPRALGEELPCDVLCALFAFLCLGRGSVDVVRGLARIDDETLGLVAASYPYAGVDAVGGTFAAAELPLAEVAEAFGPKLPVMAAHAGAADVGGFVASLAAAALDDGGHRRACELVRLLGPAKLRHAWLASEGARLRDVACLGPARELALTVEAGMMGAQDHLDEAVRCALLGERVAGCMAARRCLACAPDARLSAAAYLVLLFGSVGDAASRAAAGLASACGGQGPDAAAFAHAARAAACAVDPAMAGDSTAERAWVEAFSGEGLSPTALFAASLVLEAARCGQGDRVALELVGAAVARAAARAFADAGALTLAHAMAACSFQRAVERGALALPGLDAPCALAAARLERRLLDQRIECERAREAKLEARRAFELTHPDAFRRDVLLDAASVARPPQLTVNLFGGLEVLVGGSRVEGDLLSRQKVRALLALLVVNRGREMSRDRAIGMLWPTASPDSGRKNFYAAWSRLKAALSLPNGACPYLVKSQTSVHLVSAYVASDVLELDQVCRRLLFDHPGKGGWGQLFARIEDSFGDELLPGDCGCEAIDELRRDCKNRLVDALVEASGKLVDVGDCREGLWFARAALARDKSREDVYVALMRAQIASLQRTAALETYFACRRYLANDLGIDPSAETMRLYRSIIEDEATV